MPFDARKCETISSFATGRLAHKMSERGNVELILSNGIYGWYLDVKRSRVATINVFHGSYRGVAELVLANRQLLAHFQYRLKGIFEYLSASGKDCVVSVSEFTRMLLLQYYGLDSLVIPNGVDLQLFKPLDKVAMRLKFNLPANGTIGAFVGPASYSKGFDILKSLAKINPRILFLAMSDMPTRSFVGNLILMEKVNRQEMPEVLSACDFLISPSRFEGCNLSILEAMACDRPVVVSDTGSFYGMAGPQSFGYVCSTRSSCQDYKDAVQRVVAGLESLAPRAYVSQHYSKESFASRYRALVGRILSDHERINIV